MIRRRPGSKNAGALTVPLAMVDVWLLLLSATVLEAVFGVAEIPLPEMFGIDKAEAVGEATPGLAITVLATGEVQYDGETIAIPEIPARIKTEQDSGRSIEVNIETQDGGQGNATAFLQLVRELSKAGLGDRVTVPVKELHQ